jgi:hypothetical protein
MLVVAAAGAVVAPLATAPTTKGTTTTHRYPPSYGSGYQSHQGQQQSYNQSQYGNYGPPQGKQKGYNHGQGNYSSYSNSYNSPGGGGSDYSYESKFSELAGSRGIRSSTDGVGCGWMLETSGRQQVTAQVFASFILRT